MKSLGLLVLAILICAVVIVGLRRQAAAGSDYGKRVVDAVPSANAVAQAENKRNFERMLNDVGNDATSEFARTLSSLGLSVEELQSQPLDEAYARAHDAALKIEDAQRRRQVLATLFNEVGE